MGTITSYTTEYMDGRFDFIDLTLEAVQAGAAFHVAAYGALGNDSLVDDAVGIKAAIQAASDAGGGTVVFSADTTYYLMNTLGSASTPRIALDQINNVRLAGNGAVLQSTVNDTHCSLYFTRSTFVTIDNLVFDGGWATISMGGSGGRFIEAVLESTNFVIENCVFRNNTSGALGIRTQDRLSIVEDPVGTTRPVLETNSVVRNNTFINCDNLLNTQYGGVKGLLITGNIADACLAGFKLDAEPTASSTVTGEAGTTIISNNTFVNYDATLSAPDTGNNIAIEGSVFDVMITNNTFSDSIACEAISVGTGSADNPCGRIFIDNNIFTGIGLTAIRIANAASSSAVILSDFDITNNRFYNSEETCILIKGQAGGKLHNVRITNNLFSDWDRSVNNSPGILCSLSATDHRGISIEDNTFVRTVAGVGNDFDISIGGNGLNYPVVVKGNVFSVSADAADDAYGLRVSDSYATFQGNVWGGSRQLFARIDAKLEVTNDTFNGATLKLEDVTTPCVAYVNNCSFTKGTRAYAVWTDVGTLYHSGCVFTGATFDDINWPIKPDGGTVVGTAVDPTTGDLQSSAMGASTFFAQGATGYATGKTVTEAQEMLSPDEILISADLLQTGGGSPTRSALSGGAARPSRWLLDASSAERVTYTSVLPVGWTTYKVEVVWAPTVTAAGDVSWIFGHTTWALGDAANSGGSTTAQVDVATGTEFILVKTELATGVANTVGSPITINIQRDAGDVLDTYASDISVFWVILTKVT